MLTKEQQKRLIIFCLQNYSNFYVVEQVLRNPEFVINKADLDKALDRLETMDRGIIRLLYINGYTVRQTAEILKKSTGYVSQAGNKALEQIVEYCM